MSFLITNAARSTVLTRVSAQFKPFITPALRYSTRDEESTEAPTKVADAEETEKLGGFAKAYLRQSTAHLQTEPTVVTETQTFAALLRNSKFVDVSLEHTQYVWRKCIKFLMTNNIGPF